MGLTVFSAEAGALAAGGLTESLKAVGILTSKPTAKSLAWVSDVTPLAFSVATTKVMISPPCWSIYFWSSFQIVSPLYNHLMA
jgi:hypothetical protein